MELKAVVFDFDGVCIDTETAQYSAWQRIYESYGCKLPRDEWVKNIGMAAYVSDPFLLLELLSKKTLDRNTVREQLRTHEEAITNAMPLQPGFLDRLQEARMLGCKCAVASSSSHQWVDGHLQYRGIAGYFVVTVCREDTVVHKPHPDPYLMALQTMGIDPVHACAVEDTSTGIASAKAAGLFCIGVPSAMTRAMDFTAADLVVDSLEAVTFAKVGNLRRCQNK